MSQLEVIVRFVAGVGLLGANAFFVATEFALTRTRQFSEDEFQGSAGLRRAWEMTETLEIYLTACQLGITVTSILLGVVFEPAITALIQPAVEIMGLSASQTHLVSIVLAVMVIQLAHTVWGEQTPTYLGVERPKIVVAWGARGVYWWSTLAYPLIYFGDFLAKATLRVFGVEIERSWAEGDTIEDRGELKTQMGELLGAGMLSEERRREVMNALELDDMLTRDIMVPRDQVEVLRSDVPMGENLMTLKRGRYSRYPLVGEDLDDFRGTIYTPGLLMVYEAWEEGQVSLEEIAVEPMTVSAELSVSELVDTFQRESQELALVEDDGEIVGLVTATDASEAIVGDIADPFDAEGSASDLAADSSAETGKQEVRSSTDDDK
jgi:CBS domain containing-hemolysin-like protein